jgi:tRNA threonylcarbamoyladenosine biosynthesis protein TsaE
MQLLTNTLKDLQIASEFIKNNYWYHKIFCLSGDLGIGKTQLIKFLLPDCNVTSPSFNLLNIYLNTYWHFDIYNKDSMSLWQMEELGFYNLWENDRNKCFIEWPEKLLFSVSALHIQFISTEKRRNIIIKEGIYGTTR